MINILDNSYDNVIDSYFVNLKVTYKIAVEYFLPRIQKLDIQRNPLNEKFYKRLEEDILKGCVIPPITISIKDSSKEMKDSNFDWSSYIEKNLSKSFVLDGIQRLSAIDRASKNQNFDWNKVLYVNILICESMNKLLYRMITLNNGQKPMSARHQIEILADKIIDFGELDIKIISEKSKSDKKSDEITLNKEDIIKAYLSFISLSVNIDNQKIIEERMDMLLADKIMKANLETRELEFSDVVTFLAKHMKESEESQKWFSVANNLIGFSAAAGNLEKDFFEIDINEFEKSIQLFEKAFNGINVSKIQLGKSRRRMVKYFFDKYFKLSILDEDELLDIISQEI